MEVPNDIKKIAEKYSKGNETERQIASVLYTLMGSIALGDMGLAIFVSHTQKFSAAIIAQHDYNKWVETGGK